MNRLVGVLFAFLGCAAGAAAQCRPPHFSVGRDYGISVYVSIRARDLNFKNIACVGQNLRDQRKDSAVFERPENFALPSFGRRHLRSRPALFCSRSGTQTS
jgi:hypothetical protein